MRSEVISLSGGPKRRVQNILVIDDHPLFCEALVMTLTGALGVASVTTAPSLGDGLARLRSGDPAEAILLDLNLPDVSGFDGLLRLIATAPGVPVIVVSSMNHSRIITSVMQAGAAGFIPKNSPREVFVAAFSAIWAGKTYTPDGYVAPTGDSRPGSEPAARMADLTPKQARILELICEGKLNKEIAYDLSLAETTVKAHVTAMLRKLGAKNRTHAVLIANKATFSSVLRDRHKRD